MVHYTLYKTTRSESGDKEYKRKYTSLIDARRNAVKLFMKDIDTVHVSIYKWTTKGADICEIIGMDDAGFFCQEIGWGKLGKKKRMHTDGWTR